MSNTTSRTGSKLRRALVFAGKALLILIALLLVVAAAVCWRAFRDRNPGYVLQLDIRGQTNAGPLRVGFAQVSINPDLSNPADPIYLAGFSQNRIATAIHDDLRAVACVIDDGRTRLALVSLDAIGFFHDDVIAVRKQLAAELKLDYVMVCSTHNHSTPDLMGLWGPHYLKSGVNAKYRQQVIAGAAQAAREAVAALQTARVAFHEIPTPPEGLVADTRKPHVFDPDIRVAHFIRAESSETIGSIVGWANHPETPWSRNTEITADFPGYLRDALAAGITADGPMQGLGGTHLFLNGAVGGLMTTSPSVTVTNWGSGVLFSLPSHDKTRALGENLARRILTHLASNNVPAAASVPLSIQARTVEFPLDNAGFLLAPVLGVLDRGHVRWKMLRSEVALLQLGEASFACIPGEIYPELVNGGIEKAPGGDFGLDPVELPPIREMMPGRVKFVIGLANDELGYIIPKSEWDRKPPYLYGASKPVYGEINSVGPETAGIIHAVLREMSR